MRLPDPGIDRLIEQLREMPAGDRRAVLERLTPQEREQIRARERGVASPARAASPYSPDIAARIAGDGEGPITTAARAALAKALAGDPQPAQPPAGARSLVDGLASRFLPRRTGA
jgi:hypothetical protein